MLKLPYVRQSNLIFHVHVSARCADTATPQQVILSFANVIKYFMKPYESYRRRVTGKAAAGVSKGPT